MQVPGRLLDKILGDLLILRPISRARRKIAIAFAAFSCIVLSAQSALAVEQNDYIKPADQSQASEHCTWMVDKLQETQKAQEISADTGSPTDFVCAGDTVTILPANTPEVAPEIGALRRSEPSRPSLSNIDMQAQEANNFYWFQPGEGPRAEVRGWYEGNVETTVFYGRKTNGVTEWIRGINAQFTINLQQSEHPIDFMWIKGDYEYPITFSAWAELIEMRGPLLTPVRRDFILFNNGPRTSFSEKYKSILKQPSGNYIMSAGITDMLIIDPQKGFNSKVSGDFHVPRFLCNSGEQCKYPDGKEAPVW